MPNNATMRSGTAVNDVTPSIASPSILRRGYFDSPAKRRDELSQIDRIIWSGRREQESYGRSHPIV
jgi:hypothetical protein